MNTQRWFHLFLNGEEAKQLLLKDGDEGSFVVTHSTKYKPDFTLSVRRGNEIDHIRIQNHKDFYDLYGGDKFGTLVELLEYYMDNDLRNINGNIIRLRKPLHCAAFTKERWYHGQLTPKEAKNMLLKHGQIGSFLVHDAVYKPGFFTLSLRAQEQVKHCRIRVQDNKYDFGGGEQFDDLDSLIEHYQQYPLVDMSGEVLRLIHPFNTTCVNARDFRTRVMQLQKENLNQTEQGFWKEFEMLQMIQLQYSDGIIVKEKLENSHIVLRDTPLDAAGPYHIDANYIRCDSTDVFSDTQNLSSGIVTKENTLKLSMVPSFETNVLPPDPIYVNTPVQKPKKEPENIIVERVYNKTYIATQDCLSNNKYPFWSMIWQEDVRIIIMTTKEIERKCDRYWPELHKTEVIEDIIICTELESFTPDYTLRRFLVKKKNDGSMKKMIYHFHFTAWPEYELPPEPGRVLNILLDVKYKLQQIMTGPNPPAPEQAVICVHCSTGTGRTGAFIIIDIILDQIRREGFDCIIDISRTVQMVREQRTGMIRNIAQYKFIYMAVLEFIETTIQRVELA